MKFASIEDALKEVCSSEAPLADRLATYTSAMRDLGLPWPAAADALVERLRSGEAGANAPKAGDPMPAFMLPDQDGHLVTLEGLLKKGPAVVTLNRGHWCDYCMIELQAFAQAYQQFIAHGASVVCITPETRRFTQIIAARTGRRFPVLSDMDNSYAMTLGLTIWIGEELKELYYSDGLLLDRYQGNDSWLVPIPATFVVGRSGRIVDRHIDPDFRKRMAIDDIIAALSRADAG